MQEIFFSSVGLGTSLPENPVGDFLNLSPAVIPTKQQQGLDFPFSLQVHLL